MRSWLYCPGDSPAKMVNAGIYGPDGVVLDLEDAVAQADKDEARILVAEALSGYNFHPCAVAVRINGLGSGLWIDDLRAVVPAGARIIRIPKVESADAVAQVADLLAALERECGIAPESVRIQCILETPLGVENAFAVAGASSRVEALSFGAEDYCLALGVRRDGPPYALDYPRSRIAAAAAAHTIASCDTVWAAFTDEPGLRADAERARSLGFDGKSVIHPDQVAAVNEVFSPSAEELAWARRVVEQAGSTAGAVSVDGAMVDAPILARARRLLASDPDRDE